MSTKQPKSLPLVRDLDDLLKLNQKCLEGLQQITKPQNDGIKGERILGTIVDHWTDDGQSLGLQGPAFFTSAAQHEVIQTRKAAAAAYRERQSTLAMELGEENFPLYNSLTALRGDCNRSINFMKSKYSDKRRLTWEMINNFNAPSLKYLLANLIGYTLEKVKLTLRDLRTKIIEQLNVLSESSPSLKEILSLADSMETDHIERTPTLLNLAGLNSFFSGKCGGSRQEMFAKELPKPPPSEQKSCIHCAEYRHWQFLMTCPNVTIQCSPPMPLCACPK